MWSLKIRMWLLTAILFAIIYAVISAISYSLGIANFYFYLGLSFVIMLIQYMIGPKIVEWSMRVKYIKEGENPKLESMVKSLAEAAGIPNPRIGIAQVSIPNAFAFGRSIRDGRICVTEGIMNLLNESELKAVLGHEMSHLKNRDVLTITLLSVIPMILWGVARQFIFARSDREGRQGVMMIGLAALLFYFVANLLVLYGSRIREYYADKGSVDLGNKPSQLASALYKLVYGSARMPQEELKEVEGVKAFFVNDPSRASNEFVQLRELDLDKNGTITDLALDLLRKKPIKLTLGERLSELASTHPRMLKRIKYLAAERGAA